MGEPPGRLVPGDPTCLCFGSWKKVCVGVLCFGFCFVLFSWRLRFGVFIGSVGMGTRVER